ncbi:transcriptional regulator, MucR family [Methylobacterium sp. 4-46]|uniref:MucR family transcriptional regulator n=1 Tax=unclassified Methylobacterium TaxID=2615210 RepID=UPI000152C1F0|nr:MULTISPECIES: MucR family transcriptional regulator [Methylobacterium]ACA19062.1 transcriptional regulator, MucR family [Methylobacterium sp. 4-46]WFT78275.1 MucR family transcriptional regulator [Methylobacterium nodulans]
MSAGQANALAGSADLIEVTSGLVAAYVAHNSVAPSQVPTLLSQVHAALVGLHRPPAQELAKPVPPVPIKKTVTPDAIISLEDGRPYKSLKRHLSSRGITPDQYRQKWGLPPDYPMVAANYAAQRSELAKSIGLGQSRRAAGQKGK